MNIDWSKAPNWANVVIRSDCGNEFWSPAWGGSHTIEHILSGRIQGADMNEPHCWEKVSVRAQVHPNDNFLPPIGLECEVWIFGNNWAPATVIAHDFTGDEPVAIVRYQGYGGVCYLQSSTGKGLRLSGWEHKIEVSDRDKAIDEMIKDIDLVPYGDGPRISLGKLYDAGYRKVAP